VLDLCLAGLALERGACWATARRTPSRKSLADWPAFPEVPGSLAELKRRGWSLAILSNCDRDLIAQSLPRLGVRFDRVIVAEDVGRTSRSRSLEPVLRADGRGPAATRARRRQPVPRRRTGRRMNMPTVWVNRLGEVPGPVPDREIPDLSGLPVALEELMPG
jgi:Predicted hydrolase (HAD superfamily)